MSSAASDQVKPALARFSVPLVSFCLLFSLITYAHGNAGDSSSANDMIKLTPKCQGNNTKVFCDNADNYPAAQIENLVKRDLKRYMEFFGEDLLESIESRFDSPGEDSLCGNQERLIYPRVGKNMDQQLRFILNHDSYKQGIRIEECINVGKSCSHTESFPNSYETFCKQQYIYRPLLSLSKDEKIVKDQFQFPSSCKCIIKAVEP